MNNLSKKFRVQTTLLIRLAIAAVLVAGFAQACAKKSTDATSTAVGTISLKLKVNN